MYTIHKLHPLATHVYCVPGKHLSTNANQWGFLPRKSTITAILSAAYNWSTALEEGKEISAVFIDLTKWSLLTATTNMFRVPQGSVFDPI